MIRFNTHSGRDRQGLRATAKLLLAGALFPAVVLTAGCSSPDDRAMAERIAKIENQAKQADERSRQALSMAAAGGGQSAPPPPVVEGETFQDEGGDAPVENVIFDGEVQDDEPGQGDAGVPPPPPIAPGG